MYLGWDVRDSIHFLVELNCPKEKNSGDIPLYSFELCICVCWVGEGGKGGGFMHVISDA